MGKHEDMRMIKDRAGAYADKTLSTLLPNVDPKVKAMSRCLLVDVWVHGYAAAMEDAVIIREASRAVKH